jgi:hypothetical protein
MVMKFVDQVVQKSFVSYKQTCNSFGCAPESGYPRTDVFPVYRRMFYATADRNNKKDRNWSNYSYTRRTSNSGGGQADWWGDYYVWPNNIRYKVGTTFFDASYTYVDPQLASSAAVDAIALAKLLSSLKDSRMQYNAAVFLGEARETARHMVRTARRLVGGFQLFRKGRVVDATRCLLGREDIPVRSQFVHRSLKRRAKDPKWADYVTSAWMEFSYAWRPLLSDIDSAAKYLAEKQVERSLSVYPVSRAHKAWDRSLVTVANGTYRTQESKEQFTSVRYTYELYPKFLRQPSTMAELGFTDPATVIWELLPLSFVVDWFVNVGQVLESLFEFNQWTVKRGLKSTRRRKTISNYLVNGTYSPPNPPNRVDSRSGYFLEFVACDRQVLGSLPTSVPLRTKIDNPFDLNYGQWASAASLLRYAFSSNLSSRR